MPANVTASTIHSLAFATTGRRYQHRLGAPRVKSNEIARLMRQDHHVVRYGGQVKVLQPGFLASLAMRGIRNFCQSADREPGPHHVPYLDGIDLPTEEGKRTYANNDQVRQLLVPSMQRGWEDLQKLEGRLPFAHEHYLKLFELDDPRVPSDVIFFDEAQDVSPVMLSIVKQQDAHAQLVFVGDSQQSIYGFTGAVDALAQIEALPGTQRAALTASFRFGPEIADEANRVLDLLEAPLRIHGAGPDSTVEYVARPKAMLFRTNAKAVTQVLQLQQRGIRVHLMGGGTEVLRFAEAAQELIDGGKAYHPDLSCFDTWGEVEEYVENDPQGSDLKLMVDLIGEFGTSTIIEALGRKVSEAQAATVISTAHKAKGREWSTVRLGADFVDPGEPKCTPEELRLMYVALTRAQQTLDPTLIDFFTPQRAA